MGRSPNAQIAVDQFLALHRQHRWNKQNAWHGIALLLLSCNVWVDTEGWQPFRDFVVYRERNNFKSTKKGHPNKDMRRARQLTDYLAAQLGLPRATLCQRIGQYWNTPGISDLQYHNLIGHAFRSIAVTILETFGDQQLKYQEEVDPTQLFYGSQFPTRSERPKIDIVARRGLRIVALISTRWRYRHDRVDLVEEALAYGAAARRQNPNCESYALVGEFAPNRLGKILSQSPPAVRHGALSAAVHFAPSLITSGLQENGSIQHLKSLEWLVDQSFTWK
jgi:hypothetical protein